MCTAGNASLLCKAAKRTSLHFCFVHRYPLQSALRKYNRLQHGTEPVAHPWVWNSAGLTIIPREKTCSRTAREKNLWRREFLGTTQRWQMKRPLTDSPPRLKAAQYHHQDTGKSPAAQAEVRHSDASLIQWFYFFKNTSRGQRDTDILQVITFSSFSNPFRKKKNQQQPAN